MNGTWQTGYPDMGVLVTGCAGFIGSHLTEYLLKDGHRQKQKGDVVDTLADNSKVKRMLGWEPHVDIGDGISHYVSWRKNLQQNQGFHS